MRLFAVPRTEIVSPDGRWNNIVSADTGRPAKPLVRRKMYEPVRKGFPSHGDIELKPGVETILDDVVFKDGTRVVQKLLLSEDGRTIHVESMPQVSWFTKMMARLNGTRLPMRETMSV